MVFVVCLVFAVDMQFTQYGREIGERQNFSCVRLIWLVVVVALAVIHSQLTIFQLTKNGLHGLSGLSGLHANHRVLQERGISSDALFCYTTNSQDYQVGHSWFAWSLWSACKSLYGIYLVLSSYFFSLINLNGLAGLSGLCVLHANHTVWIRVRGECNCGWISFLICQLWWICLHFI